MPGIGELMEGAMQQAPQPSRHFMTENPRDGRCVKETPNRVTAKTAVLNCRYRGF
jgi:hypothetical protein